MLSCVNASHNFLSFSAHECSYNGLDHIASSFCLAQYIFLFQVPWLPEFTMRMYDYGMFNAMYRGRKAVSCHTFNGGGLILVLFCVVMF